MKRNIIIICLAFILINSTAYAQWECRSNLSGHLKPFKDTSNLSWAGEVVAGTGYLSNSSIFNGMGFLGIDYTKNNHQFYLEGGLKIWNKYDYDLKENFSHGKPGLREASYNYLTPDLSLTLGLQQIQLSDYFILNERGWGASLSKKVGNYQFDAAVASVTKGVARNGSFCSTCFLYDIVPSRNYPLGNSFGDTNFAFFSFKKEIENKSSGSGSDDGNEFDEFDEFESVSSESSQFLKSYGGLIYTEFGGYYDDYNLYLGLNGNFSLFKNTNLSAQAIYQDVSENNALLYSVGAEKLFEWKSGNLSTLQLNYFGKLDMDDNAFVMSGFSNLFMGEVFRMDAIDMPLINVSAKHQFVDKKLSLKLQYSQQFKGTNMQEADFSLGKYYFKKKLRTTFISGIMKSDELEGWSKLARVEFRLFF